MWSEQIKPGWICDLCKGAGVKARKLSDFIGVAQEDELESIPAIWATLLEALRTLQTDDHRTPDYWGSGIALLSRVGLDAELQDVAISLWRAYQSEYSHHLELVREAKLAK